MKFVKVSGFFSLPLAAVAQISWFDPGSDSAATADRGRQQEFGKQSNKKIFFKCTNITFGKSHLWCRAVIYQEVTNTVLKHSNKKRDEQWTQSLKLKTFANGTMTLAVLCVGVRLQLTVWTSGGWKFMITLPAIQRTCRCQWTSGQTRQDSCSQC